MARQQWPLHNGRPVIEIVLTLPSSGASLARMLLADTGAGSRQSGFELILDEQECILAGGSTCQPVALGGAYAGTFPVYLLRVQLPALAFDHLVRAVGVSQPPAGTHGIAGFRFLNRFTYGNLGDPDHFSLEY